MEEEKRNVGKGVKRESFVHSHDDHRDWGWVGLNP